ncbi:hypothetical protein Moror_10150 [Moniliophthora roreri MCA 2997]|uniref:Uncharacterized protein n=1 Tax=Moniliophthora roreri (strain MCA 2997) TaxID=1381753 RepID=V2WS50_MONRO|nr:hypothetical protein Moror_10150 [Moniliophthora roreri MCA 2997]
MLWKSICMGRTCNGKHMKPFYRYGTFFYIAVWPTSVAAVVLLLLRPQSVVQLDTFLRVMHTILCCRLVMHVRVMAKREDPNDTVHSRLTESFIERGQISV